MPPWRQWAPVVVVLLLLLVADAEEPGLSYQLTESYVGDDFFSKWDFWSAADPSNGQVDYVDAAVAVAEGLAVADSRSVYLGVDRKSVIGAAEKRRSVRIQSKAVYNQGLFIIDVEHMPTGCGTWPAFWMYGQDSSHPWPAWGEYDIIEVVHNSTNHMTTLHTGDGCVQSDVVAGQHFAGTWIDGANAGKPAQDCNVDAVGQYHNQGCAQRGPPGSAGAGFNARGGGTFAGEWDPRAGHIRTWFWPQGAAPPDIDGREPRPATWGPPSSYFRLDSETCDLEHFRNMRLVLNIDLCGDLGDARFAEVCPREAKKWTCRELVADPLRVAEAYWSIRSLDVYVRGRSNPYLIFAHRPQQGGGSSSWPSWRKVVGFGCPLVGILGVSILLAGRAWVQMQSRDQFTHERMLVAYAHDEGPELEQQGSSRASSSHPGPGQGAFSWGFGGAMQSRFMAVPQWQPGGSSAAPARASSRQGDRFGFASERMGSRGGERPGSRGVSQQLAPVDRPGSRGLSQQRPMQKQRDIRSI